MRLVVEDICRSIRENSRDWSDELEGGIKHRETGISINNNGDFGRSGSYGGWWPSAVFSTWRERRAIRKAISDRRLMLLAGWELKEGVNPNQKGAVSLVGSADGWGGWGL